MKKGTVPRLREAVMQARSLAQMERERSGRIHHIEILETIAGQIEISIREIEEGGANVSSVH